MAVKRVLLDTSAYSYLMRGSTVVSDLLDDADDIMLCTIVIGELLSGFKRGVDEKRNNAILQDFLSVPYVNVLPLDDGTSERYAVISGDKHFAMIPQIVTETVSF